MQFARNVCFDDSTASCDADNHIITFMLTPTVAGAVPSAVVITDSVSEASYTAGFMLLQTILPAVSFGGQGHPTLFITDDCDAERNALHSCWPLSVMKLSVSCAASALALAVGGPARCCSVRRGRQTVSCQWISSIRLYIGNASISEPTLPFPIFPFLLPSCLIAQTCDWEHDDECFII